MGAVSESGPREVRVCDCGAVVETSEERCPNCGAEFGAAAAEGGAERS